MVCDILILFAIIESFENMLGYNEHSVTILQGEEQIYWDISSAVLGAFVSETHLIICAEPSSSTVQQFHTTVSSITKNWFKF